MKKKTYEEILLDLKQHNLTILTPEIEYKNTYTPLIISNGTYKILETYRTYSGGYAEPAWFSKNNPYIIYNINKYFEINRENNFTCISDTADYVTRKSELLFKCNRCGNLIKAPWISELKAISDKYNSRHGITCDKCDGINESLHAMALKQVFMHEYPDTILEDRSCINPITATVMPTDIVNHKMKIAIEIQGQFHRFDNQKVKDKIKKDFWINKGYSFYDYSIDKISVLDYLKLFFPQVEDIPKYVDLNYSNKLDLEMIQNKINQYVRISDIAKELNIKPHRIYDAIYDNKLYYPNDYNRTTAVPIVQLDKYDNLISEYSSFKEAEAKTGIKAGLISSCIYYKNYYCKGFYWFYKDNYINHTYIIPQNRTNKFYQKVECYNIDNIFIQIFDDMYQAAKFCNSTASKIYEVTQNKRKTTKGYIFKICDN
mgnify:FL=1|nr:MAG TPA: intron associated endonuclease [Bacteriophage sp.]